jgi:hypothetical protein
VDGVPGRSQPGQGVGAAGPLSCPYLARMVSDAVKRRWVIWFRAAVRVLTAERAALCRARMPATVSSLGALETRPDSVDYQQRKCLLDVPGARGRAD